MVEKDHDLACFCILRLLVIEVHQCISWEVHATVLHAGNLIHTGAGEKRIEDIKVGDRVLSRNEETGEQAYKEVVQLFQKTSGSIYSIHLAEKVIEATGNHPFWVEGKEWVLAQDLTAGDVLLSSNGSRIPIDRIVMEDWQETVYNFEVADFHSYFVSDLGVWVHNENLDDCGLGNGDFITDPLAMKKHIIVPEDEFQAFLERKYIQIRRSGVQDIGNVAKNTGLTEEQVLRMKKHLFLEPKKLSVEGKPYEELYFQADPDIAYAWQKAQYGELTDREKEWFKKLANHELKEKELMDGGMPLRDPSTWNQSSKRFELDSSKNAHDKANITDPNPKEPFPDYDSGSDYIKHVDKDIYY